MYVSQNTARRGTDELTKRSVRVEAPPQHVAVSIFGYGEQSRERKRAGEKGTNVRVEFIQLPGRLQVTGPPQGEVLCEGK